MLVLLVAIPFLTGLATPWGRDRLLDLKVGWVAKTGGSPGAVGRLFHDDLARSLHRAGIDTSLLVVEQVSGEAPSGPSRWEIPLPEGFATTRGNALVTRTVERIGGRVVDAVELESNRVLVKAALSPGLQSEFLLMGKAPDSARARIALLVDRFGYRSLAESEEILKLGPGLSVAILPHTTGARDLAERSRSGGLEVLLNLPMEGLDYPRVDPGPGAILVDLDGSEIERRIHRALDQIGGASGVHTWMGDLAVEDRDVMRAVLSGVREKHCYFVESTRSSFSVVRQVAAEQGVASLKLKDDLDAPGVSAARVRQNLEALARRARETGMAAGLIHPYPATVEALRGLVPEWRRSGIELVPLSEIVTIPASETGSSP